MCVFRITGAVASQRLLKDGRYSIRTAMPRWKAPEVGGGGRLNIRMEWVSAVQAYVVLCSEHGVASAPYAGIERLTALSEARAHLMAEHTPGKVTDEWLSWVDMETEAAKKLGWG